MIPFPILVGIVNITEDSFSDGGLFLDPDKAIEQSRSLAKSGANIIELGAAPSNPDAKVVSPETEISRLAPVIADLAAAKIPISVDSTVPQVQRFALDRDIEILNDIRGFPDETMYDRLASRSKTKLVVMHSMSSGVKANRTERTVPEVFSSIDAFFEKRLTALIHAGIDQGRLIIDPGMGFFLASNPEPSLAVLGKINALRSKFGMPVMVSVSRKSFLRSLGLSDDCDIPSRTLAAELYAWFQGADYIRTHDTRALHQAMLTIAAARSAETLA